MTADIDIRHIVVAVTICVAFGFAAGVLTATENQRRDYHDAEVDCYVSSGNITLVFCHSPPGTTVRIHDELPTNSTQNGTIRFFGNKTTEDR